MCVYDSCPLMKHYSNIHLNLRFEHMERKLDLKLDLLQYVAQMPEQTETGGIRRSGGHAELVTEEAVGSGLWTCVTCFQFMLRMTTIYYSR